jgi:deferrochelatase/peroxidase EfeB
VGFGPSLFDQRLGLANRRPGALEDLPSFGGDALDPSMSGGDLCIQACADDPRVAFHAVRNLTRLAESVTSIRYVQMGSGRTTRPAPVAPTPRNLLGFHDGTNNLDPDDRTSMDRFVWVDAATDQPWMAGGTYLVARRIRIHLEAWDRSALEEQQETVGRVKSSGAPLGAREEDDPVDLSALGPNGQPFIANDAHIRQASPALNGGAKLLRRGYSFTDGIDPASGEMDAGLFFLCYQKDPSRQFVPIQKRLVDNDALSQYVLHTGSGVFACPPGVGPGEAWGEGLI